MPKKQTDKGNRALLETTDKREEYLDSIEAQVGGAYDRLAPAYRRSLARYRYYYARKAKILRHLFPDPGDVLEIGCGLGQNLAALKPRYGLGIDCSAQVVEQARGLYPQDTHPNLDFRCMSALEVHTLNRTFDTILLVNVVTEIPDILALFKSIRALCTPDTRVMMLVHNYVLGPAIRLGSLAGLWPGFPRQNWLTKFDLANLADLAGFEKVREGYDVLVPAGPAPVSDRINRYAPLVPGVKYLCGLYYTVLRPETTRGTPGDVSVSVCVPCKDEEHNIAGLADRIPEMGRGTEILFVDDRSTDRTAQRIREAIAAHPERNMRLIDGPGRGKGAACRAGFAEAQNDILVILDADMAVMPEDLPAFVEVLVSGKGEFVNGSRLVYSTEAGAMNFANIIGNKLFAMLFSFLLSQRLKDTLCGTKAIWRKDYPKILEAHAHFGKVDRWGDYDWIFGAARHNLQIVELPVHYHPRTAGQTKMTRRFGNALIMLRMCGVALRKVKLV